MSRRGIKCRKCGTVIVPALAWKLGLEIVVRCPECSTIHHTGYKMGAFLSAISLVVVLSAANLFVYITTSAIIPIVVAAVIPGWIYLAYRLRLIWIRRRK